MDNNNYIVIHGWMVNELNLKGNELMTYALIYGFSQDGETKFTGSMSYIKQWLGCNSKTTVNNILKSLTEKKLIIKEQYNVNGVTLCKYYVNIEIVQNCTGITKNVIPHTKNVPNNINNNIDIISSKDNIIKSKSERVDFRFDSYSIKIRSILKNLEEEGNTISFLKKRGDYLQSLEDIVFMSNMFSDEQIDVWVDYFNSRLEENGSKGKIAKTTLENNLAKISNSNKINEIVETLKIQTWQLGTIVDKVINKKQYNKPKDNIRLTQEERNKIQKQSEQLSQDIKEAGGKEAYAKQHNMQKF